MWSFSVVLPVAIRANLHRATRNCETRNLSYLTCQVGWWHICHIALLTLNSWWVSSSSFSQIGLLVRRQNSGNYEEFEKPLSRTPILEKSGPQILVCDSKHRSSWHNQSWVAGISYISTPLCDFLLYHGCYRVNNCLYDQDCLLFFSGRHRVLCNWAKESEREASFDKKIHALRMECLLEYSIAALHSSIE